MEGKVSFFIQKEGAFFFLLLFFFNSFLWSQEVSRYSLSVRSHYGFVMVHRPYMAIFNERHVPNLEISFARKLTGEHQWQKEFLYPEVGISANILDLGNKELLGYGIGLCWFYNLPLVRSEKINYSLKVGQGFGWIEKKFDPETNYKNFANSTTINGFVYLNNMLTVAVTDRFRPSLGLSFVHFSNGAFQKPNLGLNIPSVNVGFDYHFGKTEINRDPVPVERIEKKWMYSISLGGSVKERKPAENKNYPVIVLRGSSHITKNYKSYWGYGLDVFYEEANKYDLQTYEHIESPTFSQTMQTGIFLSYLLQAGKVNYVVEQGIYLHNRYKEDGLLYHRIGTQYLLSPRLKFNATLKTHFAVADHFEFGLTYLLK